MGSKVLFVGEGGVDVDQNQGMEVLGQEHEVGSHLRASIFALKLEERSPY